MASIDTTTDTELDRDQLCTDHLYLVTHVLNQLGARLPRHADRSDLYSAGAQGLVEASRRFDPDAGVPFATYAIQRIRGAMLDATRSIDWATRRLRRTMRTVNEHAHALGQANGTEPSRTQLAESLGMSVDKLDAVRHDAAVSSVLHLEQRIGDNGRLEDLLADEAPDRSPERTLEHRELVGTLRTALVHLPEIQREVLERHFFDGELFRDIAASMGVTEARVSQIRAEALNAIRAYFADHFDGVEPVPAGAPGVRRRAAFVAEMSTMSTWRTRLDAADGAWSPAAGQLA